jgi:riboflavin kinase / FMN adenylyltransferase
MPKGRVVTIGSFDGVHRGHQTLIEWTVREAKSRGLTPAALTFEVPPRMVLDHSRPVTVLTGPLEKELLLRRYGVSDIISLPFDHHFSKIKPFSFFRDVLPSPR